MKKVLFFLFIANSALAQTDTASGQNLLLIEKEDVVITAPGGMMRAGSSSPTTFQNLDRATLQRNNLGQDLPILLDQTPSVVSTSDVGAGIGYTGIRIRGTDATRINVTMNGVPINDAESQAVFWVNTPDLVSSTQSIQIQRGVGTSTNGSSSFGGQISLQTQANSNRTFGEAAVSIGSFNTFRGNVRAGSGLIKNKFFVEASGSWINSDGYIERAASNLRSWFAQAGYQHKNTELRLVYFGGREKTYQAWYGVPEEFLKTNRRFNIAGTDFFSKDPAYENETDNYGQDYFQLHFSHALPNKNLQLQAAAFTTLGRGYYEQYKVDANLSNYFDELSGIRSDLVRQRWLSNAFYGATASVGYAKNKLSITGGGLFSQYRGNHFGKVVWTATPNLVDKNRKYYEGNALKTDLNFYAKLNYNISKRFTLYADLQYRFVDYNTAGDDNSGVVYDVKRKWHFFNPKAGITWQPAADHQVYGSVAIGHREPNRDDIIDAPITPKPELMYNIEAGYRLLSTNFPITVNYYMMYYDNQLVLTGRLNDVGNPVKANVPVSYRTGIELSGAYHLVLKRNNASKLVPNNILSIEGNLTYSLNRILEFDEFIYTYDENYTPIDTLTQIITHSNSTIAFSPSVIASLGLTIRPLKGFELSFINKAVSKQYLDNTSNEDRKLKPFYYTNLCASYQLPLQRTDKEIKFTLLCNNIFNSLFENNGYTFSERYTYTDEFNQLQVTPTSTYNYYYPQAGFNFLVGMNVRF